MGYVQKLVPTIGGEEHEKNGGRDKAVAAYWDGASPAALAAGDVVFLEFHKTYGWRIVPVATSTVAQRIGVMQSAGAAAGLFWVDVKGNTVAAVTGVAGLNNGGEWLHGANGSAKFALDAEAGAANRTAKSAAGIREASTTDGLRKVFLLGVEVTV
jgi:hypothetical protein